MNVPSPAAAPAVTPSSPLPTTNTPAPAKATPPVTPPAPAPVAETPAQAERRKYKLKVDGQEREEELSDDEVTARLQKGTAAEKRMQEAAEVKKQFRAFQEAVKKDPVAALKDPAFGLDLRKMVEDQIIQEYQNSLLPEPDQKELTYKRELEKRDAEIKAFKDAQATAQREAVEMQVYQETRRDFEAALEKENVPKTRRTLSLMAQIAKTAAENGVTLSPSQMAAEVNETLKADHQHVVSSLRGEQLATYLGPDVVKEILRYSVEKHRGARAAPPPPAPAPEADARDQDGKFLSREARLTGMRAMMYGK